MHATQKAQQGPAAKPASEPETKLMLKAGDATRLPAWTNAWDDQLPVQLFAPAMDIQAKLEISQPGDPYEQEADRVAEQIMRMPEQTAELTTLSSGQVQRRVIMRAKQEGKGEEPERTQATAGSPDELSPATESRITSLSGGEPLSPAVRAYFEPRFGYDFSDVQVHTDSQAAESADSIRSLAYTRGNRIMFNEGQFAPHTEAGAKLLAHELTHVAQQTAGVRRKVPASLDAAEMLSPSPASRSGNLPIHHSGPAIQRKPKAEVILGEPEVNPPEPQQEQKEEWERLQVFTTGMDDGAKVLASNLTLTGQEKRNNVFIGLHPKFVKVYDQTGKSLGKRIDLKEVKGLVFKPGVYIQGLKGFVALTVSPDETKIGLESRLSIIGQRPYTAEEKAAIAEEAKKAEAEGRQPKPAPAIMVNIVDLLTEPERFRLMVESVPNARAIYFVPTYVVGAGGKGGGESKSLYASPIEGRADGQPANAPPWPVSVEGPKLVPVDSDPTYSAKVDWTANQNYSLASQVISQVGETIHYKWELFDITKYAKEQLAKDPAATKDDPAAKPEKSLEERIEDFKTSKPGTGTDVTGMGGANREFSREFEDWWKDTKRAAKRTVDPRGDTVRERLSNAAANRLSLELAPVSLLTTAIGAVVRWLVELFAGPRQQQEIPMKKEGIFLARVITTPGINEDREGKPIIRPPSVAAKVTEVTPMDRAVRESLDEPGAQLAELQSQIDLATQAGNTAKAEYLRSLLAEAKLRFEGSPLTLLTQKRDQKQKELDEFRKNYPTLSDYSRAREVAMLNDQIALYEHQQKHLASSGGTLQRVNATLISEVTGEQYPLLISAGPMSMENGRHRWMLSDVTNRDGDAFTGLGDTPSAAFLLALTKFGDNAAYGRGRIGVRTAGLGLEDGAPAEFLVDSAPADWALAEKRIDDLVTTLAALGLIVASAGTAAALIGAGVAAARLIQRWQAGKLYLDEQTLSDVLGVLGGLGAAGQLAAGLRVQKFEKVFAIVQEGKATEAQIAAAAEALKGAQQLARGVELANEAINYGGLLWGNVSFVDQMMSISDQERSGAITHAGARRARAGAISSAVQNNGLFIAGNVIKAKQQAKAVEKPTGKPSEKQPTPGEKLPAEDVLPEEGNKPAQKPGEPVPIGERRATLAELKAVVPTDIREMVVVDDTLDGDDVRADYQIDPDTGLITEIKLRCSPDARPATVALHEPTVRTMQQYQGFGGRVRLAISWISDVLGITSNTPNPENRPSFEAALEVQKLPKIIEKHMQRMRDMEPNAREQAEAELASLETQLQDNLRKLNFREEGEGAGFVAAKGMSKAKQKQWLELRAKLRTYEKGSKAHQDTRWEMYQLEGGDLPFDRWEKTYWPNLERATKSNVIEQAERDRLGWGKRRSVMVDGEERVLDIADEPGKRAVEVKAYSSGKVSATEENVSELERDGKLVGRRGWQIIWLFIDCEPTGPLKEKLGAAGITIEIRIRTGVPTEQVTVIQPPKKAKAVVR